jgi:acyl-CoA synthetase (AMP-forming)/AMP-acid ligase II
MTDLPPEPSLPAFLRDVVARFADHPLVVANGERITYGDAEARSRRLACGLLADGITKGTRVGILMPNGIDWVVTWLAAARIGALVVPINTFYQVRELAHVLRHADVEQLLMHPRFLKHDYLERLEAVTPELAAADGRRPLRLASMPFLRTVRVWGGCERGWARGGSEELERLAAATPAIDDRFFAAVESEVRPADWLTIVYSSGSTAAPKGVVHSHGTVVRHAQTMAGVYELEPGDRIYSPMPLFWVGGFVISLLAPMHAGACLLTEGAFEAGRTLDLLEAERATVVLGWPHFAQSMAEHPSFARRDLSSVRRGSLWQVLPEHLRPKDPQLRSNSLGMTETCGPHTVGDSREELPESLRGAFGRAVPGVQHKIVDPETGETLPRGELGEICVRGYSRMQALYKVEREATFDADGFYRTGDSGYFDADGWLFFRGRLGEMIKTGGANVTPAEVEAALVELPGVSEAYVAGIPDADRGQVVAAAVVPSAGQDVTSAALLDRLRSAISAYKIPRHILICEKSGSLPIREIRQRRSWPSSSRRAPPRRGPRERSRGKLSGTS